MRDRERKTRAGERKDEELTGALDVIRARTSFEPQIAVILGSGMGDLADAAEQSVKITATDIPHYPRSTVSGHSGCFVFGILENRRVVFVQGRAHLYEGHSLRSVTFPIRLVHALGAERLLVTNAAGGIHPGIPPGTLMLISDHIDMVRGTSGFSNYGAPHIRQPPHPTPAPRRVHRYSPVWIDSAEQVALRNGIRTQRGIYVWSQGPSYETRAEVSAFRRLGADAVGMSTVPEVEQAVSLGMQVLGISSITNPAAGLSKKQLSHEDVLRVGGALQGDLEILIRGILTDLSD